jgi:hypothetical protein
MKIVCGGLCGTNCLKMASTAETYSPVIIIIIIIIITITTIRSDSKLLSGFPWPIIFEPDIIK